jgi:hypothetical protein
MSKSIAAIMATVRFLARPLAGLSAATLVVAAVAAAQVPEGAPPGGGFGPRGGTVKVEGPAIGSGSGPVSRIALVTQAPVQEELKLNDAQKQKIARIEAEFKQELERTRSQLAPRPDPGGGPLVIKPDMAGAGMEEMRQAMQALRSEADAVVVRELKREQRTRLEQIRLQADGPFVFERPDVLERLNLHAPQIELIEGILAEGRGEMEQTGGPVMLTAGARPGPGPGSGSGSGAGVGAGAGLGPSPDPGPGGAPPSPQDFKKKFSSKEFQDQIKAQFESRRKATQGVRDRMMQAINRVLTRGQRANYRKMLGEPFDLKPLQTAAPNISVTTFDAPGAGAGDGRNAVGPKADSSGRSPTSSKDEAGRPKRSR